MKRITTTVVLAFAAFLSVPAMAAGEHDGHGAMNSMGHDMKMQSKAPSDTQLVEGTVKKIDKAAGKVTLAHGPLTNLGMNMGMTMAFRVKDPTWLDQMKEGDKIRFLADDVNGVYTVIRFEPAK